MLERLIDLAADELGIDPAEIRRRNLSPPDEFPYTTVTGPSYDSGDYGGARRGAAARRLRRAARRAGRAAGSAATAPLGIGVSRLRRDHRRSAAATEYAVGGGRTTDGTVTVKAGTSSHGQGHATSFAMIVADRLGIPLERSASCSPTPRSSPAAWAPAAPGRCSSAAAPCGAADDVLERGRRLAADAARGQPRGHRGDRRRRSAWPVSRRAPLSLGRARGAAAADGEPAACRARLPPGRRHVPVRCPRRGRRGRHRDRARPPAASRRRRRLRPHPQPADRRRPAARRHRPGNRAGAVGAVRATTTTGNPLTSTFADYAMPTRRRAAHVRGRQHRDAVAPEPLRRQGHRRVRHHRVDAGGAERGRRRPGHLGVRHLDMPVTPERVWRRSSKRRAAGQRPDPWREPPEAFDGLQVARGPADGGVEI